MRSYLELAVPFISNSCRSQLNTPGALTARKKDNTSPPSPHPPQCKGNRDSFLEHIVPSDSQIRLYMAQIPKHYLSYSDRLKCMAELQLVTCFSFACISISQTFERIFFGLFFQKIVSYSFWDNYKQTFHLIFRGKAGPLYPSFFYCSTFYL